MQPAQRKNGGDSSYHYGRTWGKGSKYLLTTGSIFGLRIRRFVLENGFNSCFRLGSAIYVVLDGLTKDRTHTRKKRFPVLILFNIRKYLAHNYAVH